MVHLVLIIYKFTE